MFPPSFKERELTENGRLQSHPEWAQLGGLLLFMLGCSQLRLWSRSPQEALDRTVDLGNEGSGLDLFSVGVGNTLPWEAGSGLKLLPASERS